MKNLPIYLIVLVTVLAVTSCRAPLTIRKKADGRLKIERDFENEGAHSDFVARKLFRKNHNKVPYPGYSGKIDTIMSKDEVSIVYDTVVLKIGVNQIQYLGIFTGGNFNPSSIDCLSSYGHTVLITELTDMQRRHKRRFEFWVWDLPGSNGIYSLNPTNYYIELTNIEFRKGSTQDFLKGARVTFVSEPTIII